MRAAIGRERTNRVPRGIGEHIGITLPTDHLVPHHTQLGSTKGRLNYEEAALCCFPGLTADTGQPASTNAGR